MQPKPAGLSRGEAPDVSSAPMFDPNVADLIDPRGRADRRGLLKAACIIIAVQLLSSAAAESMTGPSAPATIFALQSAVLWLSLVAVAKRLHDLGYGLRHVLAAIVTLAVAAFVSGIAIASTCGEDALLPGAPGYFAVAALTIIPALAAAIWLHAKAGSTDQNRYGPAPGPSGFSFPAAVRHSPKPIPQT